jgi:hypothetical protein
MSKLIGSENLRGLFRLTDDRKIGYLFWEDEGDIEPRFSWNEPGNWHFKVIKICYMEEVDE